MGQPDRGQGVRIAIAAAIAGFAWAYVRHRHHPRRGLLALMQAAEWFVATGGATVVLEALRGGIESGDEEITERVTHTTQTITDHAAG